MEKYKFPSQPVADPAAIAQGPQYRFTMLHPMVFRYEWAADGIFEDRASTFAINRRFPVPQYSVKDTRTQLEIVTPTYQISYNKQRFSASGLSVSFKSKVTLWGADWKFGSPPSKNNLGGTARTLDEVDGRCNMGAGILSRDGYASVDDSESMLFDGQGFVAPRRDGDRVDGYLFIYGNDFKGAMKAFFAISGPQPNLPRWALGNWWSRYHRYTSQSYLQLMDKFQKERIPLSVAVIDMDWHLVNDERVPHAGWTGYTWDRSLFRDPESFTKALHERGLKITLNDHPHAGVHHHEDNYEAFAKAVGHDTSDKAPVLFDPTSPTFMKAYLNVLHRSLEKRGCDFWWIDWQQGSISRVPGLDPLWLLNHFDFLDNGLHSRSGSLPIIFSRYAGLGSHRYPVGFSGDTIITWASLQFQPEFTATASNVGYGWWSHDLGGHMGGTRDDELTARWIQVGTFSPILRLHSSNSPWSSKEPWLYTDDAAKTMREYMELRHRLVPYIYSDVQTRDEPLCQPLYWTWPSRDEAFSFPNQYTFGKSLVVAPIVQPRSPKTNLACVKVWVPPARHVDLLTGTVYDGNRQLDMYRPLDGLPVLAPEGSIVPLDGELSPLNGCKNPDLFEVAVVVGKDGHFSIVEDERDDSGDAEGNRRRTFDLKWNQAAGVLSLSTSTPGIEGKAWRFRFISFFDVVDRPKVLAEDGSPVFGTRTRVEKDTKLPGLVLCLQELGMDEVITVHLGPDPHMSVNDHQGSIQSFIHLAQIAFDLKNKLWDIVRSEQPAATKVASLLSLGLDKEILGPIVELLVADGRSS